MVFSEHVVCVLLTFDLFSPVGKITIQILSQSHKSLHIISLAFAYCKLKNMSDAPRQTLPKQEDVVYKQKGSFHRSQSQTGIYSVNQQPET